MINYGYFRHRFDSHKDPKIIELIHRKGVAAHSLFFLILEVYGYLYSSDKNKNDYQEISYQQLTGTLRVRSDTVKNCLEVMEELGLLTQLKSNYGPTMVQLCVPNFPKYFGSYKKTEEKNLLRKEKKRKQKKIKERTLIKTPPDKDPAIKGIVDFLNQTSGVSFKPETVETEKLIRARIKEGFTIEDFKSVIAYKNKEWGGSLEFAKYLRPKTLFGNKFESYLQSAISAKNSDQELIDILQGKVV